MCEDIIHNTAGLKKKQCSSFNWWNQAEQVRCMWHQLVDTQSAASTHMLGDEESSHCVSLSGDSWYWPWATDPVLSTGPAERRPLCCPEDTCKKPYTHSPTCRGNYTYRECLSAWNKFTYLFLPQPEHSSCHICWRRTGCGFCLCPVSLHRPPQTVALGQWLLSDLRKQLITHGVIGSVQVLIPFSTTPPSSSPAPFSDLTSHMYIIFD